MASIMPPKGRVLYMRWSMAGLVLGAAVATQLPRLVPLCALAVAATLLLASRGRPAWCCAGLLAGCALVSQQGGGTLADRLADECTGKRFVIEGRVVSLPRVTLIDADRRRQRFEFEVDSISPASCAGPRRVLLSWYGAETVRPGQRWRWQARLRRPWGLANEAHHSPCLIRKLVTM